MHSMLFHINGIEWHDAIRLLPMFHAVCIMHTCTATTWTGVDHTCTGSSSALLQENTTAHAPQAAALANLQELCCWQVPQHHMIKPAAEPGFCVCTQPAGTPSACSGARMLRALRKAHPQPADAATAGVCVRSCSSDNPSLHVMQPLLQLLAQPGLFYDTCTHLL